jgi:hypothetical protein
VIFLNFVARNIGKTLYCPYGEDAGYLALLNATFGGPTEGRIQQGEVSACPPPARSCLAWQADREPLRRGGRGYWFLKVIILILSSIKHPVSSIQYLPTLI